MAAWEIPGAVLARTRFAISPMADVVGALGHLWDGPRCTDRVFYGRHHRAFAAMLDDHPPRRAIFQHLWRRGWLAEFLSLPPTQLTANFADELAQIASLGDARILADLRESSPTSVPALLESPGLTQHALDLLQWVWTHTIVSDWPRRERVLRADITSRTHRLSTHGLEGIFKDLGKKRQWRDGSLVIHPSPTRTHLLPTDAHLLLIPAHASGSWVGFSEPSNYAVYYPVSGALAQAGAVRRGALARLIGSNRAALLLLLDVPRTTTDLVALTGQPLGGVGNHLRTLREAGVVVKRRSGREVVYWRSALGDDLVAADA